MLKGERICLRTIRERDIEEYQKYNADLGNRGEHYPLDIETDVNFRNWYNDAGLWSDDFGRLLICTHDGSMLGYINFFKTTGYYEALEIGYILFKESERGKGYATEALQLFTNYLFEAKKITRLEVRVNVTNCGSKRVAEKCGYLFEGVNRGAFRKAGVLQDMEIYGMTIEDWLRRKEAKLHETE